MKFKRVMSSILLILTLFIAMVPTKIQAASNGVSVSTFNQLQTALNDGASKGTASNPYVVTVTASIEVPTMLQIYSNTKLVLNNGVILSRAAGMTGSMIMTYKDAPTNGNHNTGGYTRASNINISGGIWDSKGAEGSIMHFAHCKNITIENTTLKNNAVSHVVILDGVDTATFNNVTFTGDVAGSTHHPNERFVNEAIHIDSCTDESAAASGDPFDDTISKNITVKKCTFNGVTTAVGAHKHTGKNLVQTNVTIDNNTFQNVAETCVNGVNISNLKVTNNKASKSGAKVFVRLHGATGFTVSGNTVNTVGTFAWAYKDSTITTASSGTISNNTITAAGSKEGSTELSALQLSNGNKFTITNNTVTNSVYAALQLLGSPNSTVTGNIFNNAQTAGNAGNPYAIKILDGSDSTIFKTNTVTNNNGGGIYVRKSNKATIQKNDITPLTGKYPVSLDTVTNSNITGNGFLGDKTTVVDSNGSGNTTTPNSTKSVIDEVTPTPAPTPTPGKTGFLKDTDGKWKYFVNGSVDKTYNKLAKNSYGWFKVTKGIHDSSYTGLAENQYGWFYVVKGKVNQTHTGLIKRPEDGKWYYVEKGKWNRSYTGLAKNQYGWHYVEKGEYKASYTGLAKNQYGWHYVTKGKYDPSFTGVGKNQYGYYYVKKGKLDLTFTGIAKDAAGKWYTVVKGKATPK